VGDFGYYSDSQEMENGTVKFVSAIEEVFRISNQRNRRKSHLALANLFTLDFWKIRAKGSCACCDSGQRTRRYLELKELEGISPASDRGDAGSSCCQTLTAPFDRGSAP
jgi:hypothetical protein